MNVVAYRNDRNSLFLQVLNLQYHESRATLHCVYESQQLRNEENFVDEPKHTVLNNLYNNKGI